jgi:DNA-damage-inducible protein D
LGYNDWPAFKKVIEKSMASCALIGVPIFDHFSPGKYRNKEGRELEDYTLSRFACGMTALNGDSKNRNVAAAQAYFVSIAEVFAGHGIEHAESMDRLAIREEITEREITLSETASRAGVENYGRFNMAGYVGMYEMDYQSIRRLRDVSDKPKRSMLDLMGKDELAGNLFRLALTEGRIKKESTRGQAPLENVAKQVGRRVRQTMYEETGLYPEDLPTAQDIKDIRRGLKRAGAEIGSIDDMDANREAEQLYLAETMPEKSSDAVDHCSECSGGSPVSHNGSTDCQSGSIASGGAGSALQL